MSFDYTVILMLIMFILGMIIGILLARPNFIRR